MVEEGGGDASDPKTQKEEEGILRYRQRKFDESITDPELCLKIVEKTGTRTPMKRKYLEHYRTTLKGNVENPRFLKLSIETELFDSSTTTVPEALLEEYAKKLNLRNFGVWMRKVLEKHKGEPQQLDQEKAITLLRTYLRFAELSTVKGSLTGEELADISLRSFSFNVGHQVTPESVERAENPKTKEAITKVMERQKRLREGKRELQTMLFLELKKLGDARSERVTEIMNRLMYDLRSPEPVNGVARRKAREE